MIGQDSPATFDPMLGFPGGRKPRVLTVSAEEMEAVQLQPWEKNYCAELHVKVENTEQSEKIPNTFLKPLDLIE